jgi:hypothetical protein
VNLIVLLLELLAPRSSNCTCIQLPHTSGGRIITCAADGQVRRTM